MQTETPDATAPERFSPAVTGIADCDLPPAPKSLQKEVCPFLARHWQENLETFGAGMRVCLQADSPYITGHSEAARVDAWTPDGGRPGSSLAFMQAQHLASNNVRRGVLNPVRGGHGIRNLDLRRHVRDRHQRLADWGASCCATSGRTRCSR